MQSEEQLLQKSLSGDTRAFEELVAQYQGKVYALAFRYMGSEEDASDMAQEALLKAYKSLRLFKGNSSFGTWLYRITTNVCLDELRKRKRRISPLSLDEPLAMQDGEEVDKEIADQSPGADILYEQKEFSDYIQTLLDELRPEHKTAIVLRDVMELSYEEIAQTLDCSLGTVKSRISRARDMLRKKLVDRELIP
ncbi:MAG: sigma-70 family RNA polymerase sigma factor [Syntrophomonadaceae bacterium]|nr:sigma-70 family RNA polymerase sigma factor [Syntrophomonadaceae bacterium]